MATTSYPLLAAALSGVMLMQPLAAAASSSETVAFPSLSQTGKEVFGPAAIHVVRINAFRYTGIAIGEAHTYSPPPDVFNEIVKAAGINNPLSSGGQGNAGTQKSGGGGITPSGGAARDRNRYLHEPESDAGEIGTNGGPIAQASPTPAPAPAPSALPLVPSLNDEFQQQQRALGTNRHPHATHALAAFTTARKLQTLVEMTADVLGNKVLDIVRRGDGVMLRPDEAKFSADLGSADGGGSGLIGEAIAVATLITETEQGRFRDGPNATSGKQTFQDAGLYQASLTWPVDEARTALEDVDAANLAGEAKDATVAASLKTIQDGAKLLAFSNDKDSAYQKFGAKLIALQTWQNVFTSLDPKHFEAARVVPCPGGFKADSVAMSIGMADRTVSDSDKAKLEKPIETVVCPSRLSLTHGFGYSNIPLRTYVVAPGMVNGAQGSTVQYTQNDSGRPYLMTAIGHYRLAGNAEPVALHLSVAVTSSQGALAGGMIGLSLSLHQSLYLTAGVFRSEVDTLQNGFQLNQSVMSGTTLTTTKTAQNRVGFAISFPVFPGENGNARSTPQTNAQPSTSDTPAGNPSPHKP
jgi:hypothetical protein